MSIENTRLNQCHLYILYSFVKACEINLVKRILYKAFSLAVDISVSALFKDIPHHYLKRANVKIHVIMRVDTKTYLDVGYP